MKYFSGDTEQELEKQAKKKIIIRPRRMFVDLVGVGKDGSELWGGCDGQDTSGALKYICGILHELLKCFTCINSFSELINDLVN